MNLHSIQHAPGARRRRKRVGRGRASGMGKTSSRGTKGQMSRSGHKRKPTFEGGQMRLVRRIPKRGFNRPDKRILMPVNVQALERFEAGTEVTPDVLRQAGLVRGRVNGIKILGTGEIGRKLTVKAHAFSAAAQKKIEDAGGACEVIR